MGTPKDTANVKTPIVTASTISAPPRRALSPFFGVAKGVYSEAEAVSYIRRLRDE